MDDWKLFETRIASFQMPWTLNAVYDRLLAMPLTADVERAGEIVRRRQKAIRDARAARTRRSRQQGRMARIGFEFQQLDSRVEVFEKPAEQEEEPEEEIVFDRGDAAAQHQQRLKDAGTVIDAPLFGRESRWFVVADGDNLEFVTAPFHSLTSLRRTMSELVAVAEQRAKAERGASYRIGDTGIVVDTPGKRAQPQANPDIPLDALPALVIEAAKAGLLQSDQFSADTNYWSKERTDAELAMMAKAASAIQALDAKDLAVGMGGEVVGAASAQSRSARGLLVLLVNACIHQEHFKTQLVKDMPILSKVHLGRAWLDLAERGVVGKQPKGLAALLERLYPAHEVPGRHAEIVGNVVKQVLRGVDPVWSSVLDLEDIDKTEASGGAKQRKQVLIELRRSPVIPIDEWLDYAVNTYAYFIADAARRFD